MRRNNVLGVSKREVTYSKREEQGGDEMRMARGCPSVTRNNGSG